MADNRQEGFRSIRSRYDLEVTWHQDVWRSARKAICWMTLAGSTIVAALFLVFDHRVFESQCVSSAHRVFEKSCSECHDRHAIPLIRMLTFNNTIRSTSDDKCVACHRKTEISHLDFVADSTVGTLARVQPNDAEKSRIDLLKKSLKLTFDKLQCADCHQEHRGLSALRDVSDSKCTNCHTDVHNQIQKKQLEILEHKYNLSFTSFEGHSEFRIWQGSKEKPRPSEIVEFQDSTTRDRSNIKFNHRRHLDPRIPDSQNRQHQLNCADCHQSDPSGAYFLPIRFEDHCQKCHKLGTTKTTVEVPHLEPQTIHELLLNRRYRKLIENDDPINDPKPTDKLGGPTQGPIVPKELIPQTLVEELRTLEDQLFGPIPENDIKPSNHNALLHSTCSKCHKLDALPVVDGRVAWKVMPTNIPKRWMGHSRFRHDRHSSVDCQYCHTKDGQPYEKVVFDEFYPKPETERTKLDELMKKMRKSSSIYASETARDVLMPRIELCRDCHGHGLVISGSRGVKERCADCHGFHHFSPKTDETEKSEEAKNRTVDLLLRVRPPKDQSKPEAGEGAK